MKGHGGSTDGEWREHRGGMEGAQRGHGECEEMEGHAGAHGGVQRGPSLYVLGYHQLLLATIHLVGDNRELEV